jgi:hypothetical protein
MHAKVSLPAARDAHCGIAATNEDQAGCWRVAFSGAFVLAAPDCKIWKRTLFQRTLAPFILVSLTAARARFWKDGCKRWMPTDIAPALCPQTVTCRIKHQRLFAIAVPMVTLLGSPPNAPIFLFTHLSATS